MSPARLPLALALLLSFTAAWAADDPRVTIAERSGFVETGRYDEVIALCDTFARLHPDAVRCVRFGTSPEGRPMQALVASRSGHLDPGTARAAAVPVVLVQGGIHAGEIDGKDAGFLALRELLDGTAAPGALEDVVLVFVPVFNVDGHERFGAWNRPNQRGPREMGWRTTAQNYNLNRDYAKADAPEMQAMLALVEAWDPIAYVDLHATNGAQFEHDISIQVEPVHAGDDALRAVGRTFRDAVMNDLAAQGSLPLPYYPSFVEHDNPASGFEDGVSPPRFSTSRSGTNRCTRFWCRGRGPHSATRWRSRPSRSGRTTSAAAPTRSRRNPWISRSDPVYESCCCRTRPGNDWFSW